MEKIEPSVQTSQIDVEKAAATRASSSDDGDKPPYLKPAEWPTEPTPLVPNRTDQIFMNIYDGVLIAAPLFLIIKAGLCFYAQYLENNNLNDGPNIDQGTRLTMFLINFNSQLATAFTVLFVMVITTLLKRLALWRAQRGAYVSTLEQYQASSSLPSTVKVVWSLRAWSLTSLALVLIWCFYYVGSQAAIHEYTLHMQQGDRKVPIAVPNFDTASLFAFEYTDSNITLLNSLFLSKYLPSTFQSVGDPAPATDSDGLAILPFVNQDFPLDKNGWSKIEHPNNIFKGITQSGYVGVEQWTQLGSQLVGEYGSTSAYFQLQCLPWLWIPRLELNVSTTQSMLMVPRDNDKARIAAGSKAARLFDIYSKGKGGASTTTCAVSMITLDIRTECNNSGLCRITRYKPRVANDVYDPSDELLGFPGNSPYLNFTTPFNNNTLFKAFLDNLVLAFGVPVNNDTSSLFETTFYGAESSGGLINMTAVGASLAADGQDPNDGFNEGLWLTTMFNSYYFTSLQQTGNPLVGDYNPLHLTPAQVESIFYHTTFKGGQFYPEYRVEIAWIVVDIISCTILFVAAILSYLVRGQLLAPDIFGYVSSLTRDNPLLHLPEGGTALSGFNRARAMKNVKIKISDYGDGDVGKVGIGLATETTKPQLQEGKAYL